MIENVALMTPDQASKAYRTPTYDGSLWGSRVCRCNGHIDPHEHTRMHPRGRSIFEEEGQPLRPPPAYVGIRRHPPAQQSTGLVDAKAAGLSAVLAMLVFSLAVDAALVVSWLTS